MNLRLASHSSGTSGLTLVATAALEDAVLIHVPSDTLSHEFICSPYLFVGIRCN
jgi:hypothetical protein